VADVSISEVESDGEIGLLYVYISVNDSIVTLNNNLNISYTLSLQWLQMLLKLS
jgi:hypothetical protein